VDRAGAALPSEVDRAIETASAPVAMLAGSISRAVARSITALVGPMTRLPARRMSALADSLAMDPFAPIKLGRSTRIIATFSPKCLPITSELIKAGVGIVRLNCSHGDEAFYREAVSTIRAAVAAHADVDFSDGAREDCVAIAFDTKGPEIRTGKFTQRGSEVRLERGDALTLSTDESMRMSGTKDRIFVGWPSLVERVSVGQRIVLDDGIISLRVDAMDYETHEVLCEVTSGGLLGESKGVHVPGVDVDLPAMSPKDVNDLKIARDLGADFIMASFIREASQVEAIRAVVGPSIGIISKIENRQGIDNFDEILAVSDGVMVARGDLGIEIPLERVFLVQKNLIAKAQVAGKPVICATQMLESMTKNPLPTRAECVDVGNAVLDGADAVMLSGETAKGDFPRECVTMMARLCQVAEASQDSQAVAHSLHDVIRRRRSLTVDESLAASAVQASLDHDAKAIVVLSTRGATARLLSKFRPSCPIVCVTYSDATARALQVCRGVHSIVVPNSATKEQALAAGVKAVVQMGLGRPGDPFLTVVSRTGHPVHGDPKTLGFDTIPKTVNVEPSAKTLP
jgi:pyruvate kinase